MLQKPDTCKPCPLYGEGIGFVPGSIPDDAEMIVVGQNPGQEEENSGRPLVGATGRSLNSVFLPLTGIDTENVGRDNVIRCRWRKSNELPKGKILEEAITCCSQYDVVPDTVRLIVAMGAVALSKYGPGLKQHEWRGHLLPNEHEIHQQTARTTVRAQRETNTRTGV